jgi:AAA domain
MTTWFLDSVEIEGFRGINNEGDPLVLNFARDAVNSVSAPNGVGKSSIFDALTFALRKRIPKLDELQSAENGATYYVNRFHSKGTGTVKLTVSPAAGGAPVPIVVTRDRLGKRCVSAPTGIDGEALLSSLDRDFVLLDHRSLQSFIDDKALDRGRSFAGLLGLARYSDLRQKLQALSNTTAFNNHFNTRVMFAEQTSLKSTISSQRTEAAAAFQLLTQRPLADQTDHQMAVRTAHAALHQIAILMPHCKDRTFAEINFDECLQTISLEEGGQDKVRHVELVRLEATLTAQSKSGPSEEDHDALKNLASQRDAALSKTAGSLLQALYAASRDVLSDESWTNKHLCPVCEVAGDAPLLPSIETKLNAFELVADTTAKIEAEWIARQWEALEAIEAAHSMDKEPPIFRVAGKRLVERSLNEGQVERLWAWRGTLMGRVTAALSAVTIERLAIEKRLPKSLVAVAAAVGGGRRLQAAWKDIESKQKKLAEVEAKLTDIARVKRFVDTASGAFAVAEAECSKRRLSAVEPLCQTLFTSIMHQRVKPALVKSANAEAISLELTEFFTLRNVSAQALLSESFRNAFAVSVYLAAASLYGGAPRFVILDDVTSSFDAGHQFHLMELIRTQFARPRKPDGPQVILLSHDTLLEKLFKRHANASGWTHQRLEGTARTAVLPQSDAINRVRDATERALNAGQIESATPWLRRYLEHTLLEIIQKVRIPVPIDFALDDNQKQVQHSVAAIEAAVKLHQAAGDLILDATQVKGIALHMASIIGNFVSHEATGSTSSFSAPSLLGVLRSIDDYADCFKTAGPGGTRRYCKSLTQN